MSDEPEASAEVTQLLANWGDDGCARERLIALVYDELRRLAASVMEGGAAAPTLQPTAVVNEAMIKLLRASPIFDNRRHFFATAASAMRQVLVDHYRRKHADKRGGGTVHLSLDLADSMPVASSEDLLALDDALRRLEQLDAQAARIVELRYFAGLNLDETAATLGVHPSTVGREWAHARAWLRKELGA